MSSTDTLGLLHHVCISIVSDHSPPVEENGPALLAQSAVLWFSCSISATDKPVTSEISETS